MNDRHPGTQELLLGLDNRPLQPAPQTVIFQTDRDESEPRQIQQNGLKLLYAGMPMLHRNNLFGKHSLYSNPCLQSNAGTPNRCANL